MSNKNKKHPLCKTSNELKLQRIAAKILAEVHILLKASAKVGISLATLDKLAYDYIISQNATPGFLNYAGFEYTICASVNDVLIHGVPDSYVLKDGDLLSIDVGVKYQGLNADAAFSMTIGFNPQATKLIHATEQCLIAAMSILKAGVDVKMIGKQIQMVAESHNYYLTKEYSGHGVGKKLHELPHIFNYYEPSYSFILQENMVIAIEPMLLESTEETILSKDGWSVLSANGCLCAHAEHTILIKKDGYEILTQK